MITADQLEQQWLSWFREGGSETVFGPDISHYGAAPFTLSRTLATLRDTLLPKLRRGGIRISKAN